MVYDKDAGVLDADDPLGGVIIELSEGMVLEEEYKLKNDKAYCWKALRLMAKKDVSLLSKVSAPGGSLESAVKSYDDKLKGAKEAPEEMAIAKD